MADLTKHSGKKHESGRWLVWTGAGYQKLEDLPDHVRSSAYNYLSGEDLKEELKVTTEKSKAAAYLSDYVTAKKYAVVADEIEALLANGGDRHG